MRNERSVAVVLLIVALLLAFLLILDVPDGDDQVQVLAAILALVTGVELLDRT